MHYKKLIKYKKTLGTFLKYLREINGLTQCELAKKLDITQAEVSRIESDRRTNVNIKRIDQICKVYEITSGVFAKEFDDYLNAITNKLEGHLNDSSTDKVNNENFLTKKESNDKLDNVALEKKINLENSKEQKLGENIDFEKSYFVNKSELNTSLNLKIKKNKEEEEFNFDALNTQEVRIDYDNCKVVVVTKTNTEIALTMK